jgi:hypothetical protein
VAISLKSQKLLWGRAAARCSLPECRILLVEDPAEADDPTLIGENCHVVAESNGGPRADPSLPQEQRDTYANLILLCRNHHRLIDDQPIIYPVERLQEIKVAHEQWVRASLGVDESKLRDDAIYADYVDRWEAMAHLDEWKGWSSFILGSGQPRIRRDVDQSLADLRPWLISRVWSGRYPALERAFLNFGRVLQDFQNTYRSHLSDRDKGELMFTEKFYQIDRWDPEAYTRLSQQYDFHVDLVSDLMVELTRAANLICDEVRSHLSHAYRLDEGRLMVQRGPDINFQWAEFVPLYLTEERQAENPYPGLEAFYDVRTARDWHIGEGHPS